MTVLIQQSEDTHYPLGPHQSRGSPGRFKGKTETGIRPAVRQAL